MEIVDQMERIATDERDAPKQTVQIEDCGHFTELSQLDKFPDFPEESLSNEQRVAAANDLKVVGNDYFKAGNFTKAVSVYGKVGAIKYLN